MAYSDNFQTALIDLVDSLVDAEKMNFSNLLFNAVFLASDITKSHTIITGVRNGNIVPIISKEPTYKAFPFIDASTCDTKECNVHADYSSYKWDLALISCRVPICLRKFDDNFLLFWNEYKMLNPTKVESKYMKSAMMQYIVDLVKDEFEASRWRGAYYAMTSYTSDLLNGFNGFFAQAEGNNSLVVKIPKNDTDQHLTGEEIYQLLVDMEDKFDLEEWSTQVNKMEFRMTRRMAKTLASYLNKLTDTTCCSGMERLDPEQIGKSAFKYDKLAFHGYPIIPVEEWDFIQMKLKAELPVAPATNVRVNRVLFVEKTNMLIGTEERDQLSMLDVFYEKKDKKVYIDAEAYYGVAIPLKRYIMAI